MSQDLYEKRFPFWAGPLVGAVIGVMGAVKVALFDDDAPDEPFLLMLAIGIVGGAAFGFTIMIYDLLKKWIIRVFTHRESDRNAGAREPDAASGNSRSRV